MDRKLEARIQKEIRMRVFERADKLRQIKQHRQQTRYTLDALQEVTGLPRPELESIADEITLCVEETGAGFFSIKNQLRMTFAALGFIFILSWCVYMI